MRAGVVRAIDDAEAAGAIGSVVASGLRALAERLPVDEAIGLIADASSLLDGADGAVGGLLDQVGGLLP